MFKVVGPVNGPDAFALPPPPAQACVVPISILSDEPQETQLPPHHPEVQQVTKPPDPTVIVAPASIFNCPDIASIPFTTRFECNVMLLSIKTLWPAGIVYAPPLNAYGGLGNKS